MPTEVRTGQMPELPHDDFIARFKTNFYDPNFSKEGDAINRLAEIAWQNYSEGRKAPITRKAGKEYKDPDYDMSVEWYDTAKKLEAAQKKWEQRDTESRVLIINGSPRNDGTCPGEISKTWRMAKYVKEEVGKAGMQADLLDLAQVTAHYGREIHPCKGCLSTAMPLCHWPCSCYPNHASGQVNDWMAEIYERWVSAHGVIILAPTHWYQSPSVLKSMIDRLVCADGGNPDPTSTHGKKAAEAKAIEERGWDYPKHLAGRVYGLVVHGDVAGVEVHRRNLSDWLDWIGMIDAGQIARLDRYLGYFQPYWSSHEDLDKDTDLQEEVRNVAKAVTVGVKLMREGKLPQPAKGLRGPRVK